MSKMSELHRELTECAYDLGFESIEEAEANGYTVDYATQTLVDGRELAHQEYIEKKEAVLPKLQELKSNLIKAREPQWGAIISDAIDLIEKGDF